MYPPSLDFIVAFIGCLKAGLIAVPTFPPDPRRLTKDLKMFANIANIFESFVSLLRSGGKVGTAIRPALRHPMNAAMKSRDRG